jgi:hypothetical protein
MIHPSTSLNRYSSLRNEDSFFIKLNSYENTPIALEQKKQDANVFSLI